MKSIIYLSSAVLFASSAFAASIIVQDFDYFATDDGGFSDGDISVFDGAARWSGVTDSSGATPSSGTFGDGTVLDYRFVGSDRTNSTLKEHANGGGTYLTSAFTVVNYGQSGGPFTGLDVWTTFDPDDVGSFDTTPNSDAWTEDHTAGGDQLRGVIDVSGLLSARIYFIYGSFDSAATIDLGTTVAGSDLGTLTLAADGPDNSRLVIQEVTIDNDDGSYGIINFNYSASNNAGRGRFSGVIVDGVVPEPSTAFLLGFAGLSLLIRRRR